MLHLQKGVLKLFVDPKAGRQANWEAWKPLCPHGISA